MPSLQAALVKKALSIRPHAWANGSIEQQRAQQDKSARYFPVPRGLHLQRVQINDLSGEWLAGANAEDAAILYLHGGAYALGSVASHRELLARLAFSTRRKILAIDYRLAPEHPFPAALEDATTAYRWLLAQGFDPARVAIAGDSAGGGLALAALAALRDAGDPLPGHALCFSPWVDLSLSGASVQDNAGADPILNAALLERFAGFYAGQQAINAPLISPLFADLRGLPPILVQVGGDEILLDDAVRLAEAVRNSGGTIQLNVFPGLFHVFQLIAFLPETTEALRQAAEFLQATAAVSESG